MINNLLNTFLISTSVDYSADSDVNIKSLEIRGDNIGINNEIDEDSLKGKFRLMNGKIYRVIDEEPPASALLKLSEQIDQQCKD